MKNNSKIIIIAIAIFVFFISFLLLLSKDNFSKRLSTEKLASEIKSKYEEDCHNGKITNYDLCDIKRVGLTHEDGNVYSGVIETNSRNYGIEVVYDGEHWTCKFDNP